MIYYCYRQTEDWKKNNISNFWYLKSTSSYEKLCHYIEKWSEINDFTYFDFRQILKNVSEKIFLENGIKKIDLKNILDLGSEDWIIPFDDDDWFCSDFKKNIEQSNSKFIYGDVFFYNIHSGESNLKTGHRDSLYSCQYAIRVDCLKKIDKKSFENIIFYHYLAKKEIIKNKIKKEYFPEVFSARTFHFASTDYIVRNNFSVTPNVFFSKKNKKFWCDFYAKKIQNKTIKLF